MNYAFIGCGNMAGAILERCLKVDFIKNPSDVWVCENNNERLNHFKNTLGTRGGTDPTDAAVFGDIIILGVKPNIASEVVEKVVNVPHMNEKLVISMIAGYNTNNIFADRKTPFVRIMPNLNAKNGGSVTGVAYNEYVNAEQKQTVYGFVNAFGSFHEIPEKLFGVFTAIAGCSPAFTYMYVDALARAAARLGMDKKQALSIAAKSVWGSAENLAESSEHPWELIDQVCSPGGMTAKGVYSLQKNAFEAIVSQAVEECLR
ncbi:MAG: pyrroline-5-carboxylate reductase [Clostridiales bacterium]|nr:pyrroline-5-carboxylate reductase [Clostridiales bacterium]